METLSIKGFEGAIEVVEIVLDKKNVLNTFYCNEIINCGGHAFSRALIIDSKDIESLKNGEFTVLSAMPDWYKMESEVAINKPQTCSIVSVLKNLFK